MCRVKWSERVIEAAEALVSHALCTGAGCTSGMDGPEMPGAQPVLQNMHHRTWPHCSMAAVPNSCGGTAAAVATGPTSRQVAEGPVQQGMDDGANAPHQAPRPAQRAIIIRHAPGAGDPGGGKQSARVELRSTGSTEQAKVR